MKTFYAIFSVFVAVSFFCLQAALAQTATTTKTTTETKTTTTVVTPGIGDGTVDKRLSAINEQAKSDLNNFVTRTSSHFGVPPGVVDSLLNRKMSPSDVYMSILLSKITKKPVENVVEVYDANKGKGWGVIAKQMGVKPGSAEFHALKKDNFSLKEKGKGKAKSKAKGQGKGKGKGNWKDNDD